MRRLLVHLQAVLAQRQPARPKGRLVHIQLMRRRTAILDVQRNHPCPNRQRRRHHPKVMLDHHYPGPTRRRPMSSATRQASHNQNEHSETARPAPTPPRATANQLRSRHPRYIGIKDETLSNRAREPHPTAPVPFQHPAATTAALTDTTQSPQKPQQ